MQQVTQQQSGQQQPLQPVPVAKRLRWFINTPWVLLLIPLLVGGFWLVLNPWVIVDNLNKPYALLAGPAFVGSLLAGWIVIKFFAAIERFFRGSWALLLKAQSDDGGALFFWIVITVFMVVSVFASGSFFAMLEQNAFPGLGYATALFIDLIAVQGMRARLGAARMRDKKGARMHLLGVFICAGASAFANVFTSLQDFHMQASGALPAWMVVAAPWFGLIFPLLIVLLSMTADYTVDQYSGGLDPERYRAQEAKRVKMLEIQRDMLRDRVTFEREIDQLTARLKSGDRRVSWFLPKRGGVQMLVDEANKEMNARIEELTKQNGELLVQLQAVTQSQDYNSIAQSVVQMLDSQLAEHKEAILLEMQTKIVVPTAQETSVNYVELALVLAPMIAQSDVVSGVVSDLVESRQSSVQTAVNYAELALVLAPMIAQSEDMQRLVQSSPEQSTSVDLQAIAQSVVQMLDSQLAEKREAMVQSVPVTTKETDHLAVVSADSHQETDQLSALGDMTKKDHILTLLRQDPGLSVTDLVVQTGAKRDYVYKVKSQFVAEQQ